MYLLTAAAASVSKKKGQLNCLARKKGSKKVCDSVCVCVCVRKR